MTLIKKSVILASLTFGLVWPDSHSKEAKQIENWSEELVIQEIEIESNTFSEEDIYCLEAVVFNETSGRKAQGSVLVGATVLNRMNNRHYPDSVCGVVYQRAQYTNVHRVNPDDINEQTKNVVQEIIKKYNEGNLNQEVIHFHNDSVSPAWASQKKIIAIIGNHIFYAG